MYDMFTVPDATPLTTPVPDTTVAIRLLLLAHVPPPVAFVSVVVVNGQIANVPAFIAVAALTVATIIVYIPGDVVYVMFAFPTPTPVSIPVTACTVAIDVLLLLHVPPDTGLLSVEFV